MDPAVLAGAVNSWLCAELTVQTTDGSKRSNTREGQVCDHKNLRDRNFKKDHPASSLAHDPGLINRWGVRSDGSTGVTVSFHDLTHLFL